MATLRMALALPYLATNNAVKLEKTPTDQRKEEVLTDIGRILEDVAGGLRQRYSGQTCPSLKLSIDESTTAAHGTATCASVANNDTVTVGNQILTAKTSGPSGANQWLAGVSDTADGVALAACINAHATLSQYVLATAASGVVTVTAIGPALGVLGNAIILASSNNTRLAVVAMASGANDASAQTYSF